MLNPTTSIEERAAERHAARTPEKEAVIRKDEPNTRNLSSDNEDKLYFIRKEYDNGGVVKIMKDYDDKKNDYKAILTIANYFAQNGAEVLMPHPLHVKSQEYKKVFGKLIGTKYESKCPDLIINGTFYEFEGFVRPWKKQKVGRMISHGLAQSNRIIIDNNKGCSDRFIRKAIMARANLPKQDIQEVWIYEKGIPRLFYKDGHFYKKQQENRSSPAMQRAVAHANFLNEADAK